MITLIRILRNQLLLNNDKFDYYVFMNIAKMVVLFLLVSISLFLIKKIKDLDIIFRKGVQKRVKIKYQEQ